VERKLKSIYKEQREGKKLRNPAYSEERKLSSKTMFGLSQNPTSTKPITDTKKQLAHRLPARTEERMITSKAT
jgi:hypothetical protein